MNTDGGVSVEDVMPALLKDTDILTWLRSTHPAWLEPKEADETVN